MNSGGWDKKWHLKSIFRYLSHFGILWNKKHNHGCPDRKTWRFNWNYVINHLVVQVEIPCNTLAQFSHIDLWCGWQIAYVYITTAVQYCPSK
jgi:hypothetical protein